MRNTRKPRRKARLFLLLAFIALTLSADELADLRKASEARPQHPTLLYRLAIALDKNGQREEAARALDRVAAMGFVYDAAKHFPHERYAVIRERMARNARPIGSAREEFTIDRIGLIPEGLAWDGKRFFVGSVRAKKIFADGKEFATAPWGVFGMAADPKRGVLWATTTALPQVEGFVAEDKGKSALLRIDLKSGRVLQTLTVEGAHHFGDVTVAPDGEVYVSDSASPVIYRVHGNALAPFVRGEFVSLQGLAVVGRTLYVADYSKGLFAIDRRTLDVHPLAVPANISLLGVDGLYAVDAQTLVATQNGTNPNRIVRIHLAPGGLRVMAVRTLLANVPELGDPTLGAVANGRFHFNAKGQWELFGEDGKIADPLALTEAIVLSVPLR